MPSSPTSSVSARASHSATCPLFFVSPVARGQGVGEALVNAILQDAAKCDGAGVSARVMLPHCLQTSLRFWEKRGFNIGHRVDKRSCAMAFRNFQMPAPGVEV